METPAKIETLIQTLNQIGANPADPGLALSFRESLEQLRQSLLAAPLNDPHPTLSMNLDSIGARSFIGARLFERVKDVISANQLAPQQAAAALQQFSSKINKFYDTIGQLDDAFTELGVEYTEIEPGENEIGISIPVEEGTKTLKDLSKKANNWHNSLSPFVELYSSDKEPIKLRVMSSSDWQFYLFSTPPVLLGISMCIRSVNQILADLIHSKELIAKLAKSGTSASALEAVRADTDGRLESQIRTLADDTVDTNYKENDAGRKNELKNALSQSLNFIAREIASGVTLEVRLIPPDPVKEAESEQESPDDNVDRIAHVEELRKIADEIHNNMEFPPLVFNSSEPLVLPGLEEDSM
ncbi:hypothetical protein CPter91_3632 [Collimonas pratensis]|uniref:Uncharacterized protein n=1 Tax=Collimonas pratensis TaxID=279113 RepID=A0A127Q7D9_9BURK|nr:hypothetical protein CPter91_3632 [Collimonas pratensis]